MEEILVEHIVDFHKYCEKCIHKDVDSWEDPCDDCLCDYFAPYGRPTCYQERGEVSWLDNQNS